MQLSELCKLDCFDTKSMFLHCAFNKSLSRKKDVVSHSGQVRKNSCSNTSKPMMLVDLLKTLQGTKISPPKACLKMIFLFPHSSLTKNPPTIQ